MVPLRFAVLGQLSILTTAYESASLEHVQMHTLDDAVSLLQHQVRVQKHQTAEEHNETWAGGYMKCTEQQPFTRSGCRTVGGGLDFAIHPRLCAQEAKVRGVDSFEFSAKGDDTWCLLKQCDSVDMKWQATNENWRVYSQFCGLERNMAKIDGSCREAITGNLIFPRPRRSACKHGLKFKSVSVNNLRGAGPNRDDEGHMRVLETLPGVDLIIRADENYVSQHSGKNGIHLGKFARINIKAGTSTVLNFEFVRSGTMERIKVPEFVFTVFDLDQFKRCYGRKSITASHFASYHLSDDTELITKTDAGAPGREASSTFMSSMPGTKLNNPTKPREMTEDQKKRAVTFVFKNRQFFNLHVEVSAAAGGKNFLFGGKSSMLDGTCPRKRTNAR